MSRQWSLRAATLATLAALSVGCGGAAVVATGPLHDQPVPASVSRAEVTLRVDLPAKTRCEEAFDLALYQDLAIDLITWDAAAGACTSRAVTIRYFPSRASEPDVVSAARALSLRATKLAAGEGAEKL